MAKISKNGAGLLILLLSLLGVNVVENDAIEFLSALGTIVSFVLMIWNQLDRKDVAKFFFKK